MHNHGSDMHPDAKARSGMLSELARRWAQRVAAEWTESAAASGGSETLEEREEGPR